MGLRNSPPGISCVDVPVGISYISLLFAFVHDNLPAFNNAFGHRGVNNHHVAEHTPSPRRLAFHVPTLDSRKNLISFFFFFF